MDTYVKRDTTASSTAVRGVWWIFACNSKKWKHPVGCVIRSTLLSETQGTRKKALYYIEEGGSGDLKILGWFNKSLENEPKMWDAVVSEFCALFGIITGSTKIYAGELVETDVKAGNEKEVMSIKCNLYMGSRVHEVTKTPIWVMSIFDCLDDIVDDDIFKFVGHICKDRLYIGQNIWK